MKPSKLHKILSLHDFKRKIKSHIMVVGICLMALIAIYPLMSIFVFVFQKGWAHLDLNFFLNTPTPVGTPGGGLGPSVLGSLYLVAGASLIGIPWGIASAVYMTEFGYGKTAFLLRFSNDMLLGVPSIVFGVCVYILLVVPMKGFSWMAGSMALAFIMIPLVSRTTEEILKTVPHHIREAGLALGIPRYKVIMHIILKGSWSAIFTGVILAIARISGETAPLLFTSFNNQNWSHSLGEPVSSLPVQIYTYAMSPFEEWQAQAWTGSLVLILFIFSINLVVRLFLNRKKHAK